MSVDAQDAYFSVQGSLDSAGATPVMTFDLLRPVGSDEPLVFQTFGAAGGVNAAGQVVVGGGPDPVLRLIDSVEAVRGEDDNSAGGGDALLSWAGLTLPPGVPLSPDPLSADGYLLELASAAGVATGGWAVDLVGPADAVEFAGPTPSAGIAYGSLAFGTTGVGGAARYEHNGVALTLSGELEVAATGEAVLAVSSGEIEAQGVTAVRPGGTVQLTQTGILNATGGVVVDGGTLTRENNAVLVLGAGTSLVASNGANVLLNGTASAPAASGFNIDRGTVVEVLGGATLDSTGFIDIGSGSPGTLLADGVGSVVRAGVTSFWGSDGSVGAVTLRNGATAELASNLHVALSSVPGTGADVRVESGATLDVGRTLTVASAGAGGGTGSVTVSGVGSVLNALSPTASRVIGNATTGSGRLVATDGGVINLRTTLVNASGTLRIESSGTLNVFTDQGTDGGFLASQGTILVDEGTLIMVGVAGSAAETEGGTADAGGSGGVLSLTGGSLDATGGILDLSGGVGGSGGGLSSYAGGQGGSGGRLELLDADAVLNGAAVLTASGGAGSPGLGLGGGDGGHGGELTLDSGSFTQRDNSQVRLQGGAAGTGSGGGASSGGDGGAVRVRGGVYTVADTARLSVLGGAGDSGNNGGDGVIDLSGGTFVFEGGTVEAGHIYTTGGNDFVFNGGTLAVLGFDGDLTQDGGVLAPGRPLGTTTVQGDYTLNTGTLAVDLAGTTLGDDHDAVTADTVTLGAGSTLAVSLQDGFTPTVGDVFELLNATVGISGVFGAVDLPLLSGSAEFSVVYDEFAVTLAVVSAGVPGDYNGSGLVEQGDLDLVLQNWGLDTTSNSIPNGWVFDLPEGLIDQAELDGVLQNWGNAAAPNFTAAQLPEPSSLMLVALTLFHCRPRGRGA